MSDFTIRPMRKSDEPFVYKAWLTGYWPHFPGNVIVSKSEFLQRWHGVIERILADPRVDVRVAHVLGQEDVLLGFVCGGRDGLHWAYVKQAFRKLGICWELRDHMDMAVNGSCFRISHWPGGLKDGWTYAPELLKEYGA